MPRLSKALPTVRFVCYSGLLGLLLCAGCPNSQQASESDTADATPAAAEPAGAVEELPAGPPPERYATLPPGAFDEGADGAPAQGAAEAAPPARQPADPGLIPNADSFNLTGVRLGMNVAEIEGRYPPDSGWAYDKQFVGDGETGMLIAKPRDARARASELIYVLEGSVAAFLRVVQEDGAAYTATSSELARQFGSGEAAPPQWSRNCSLLRTWRTTANEQALFWGDQRHREVLTAGHNTANQEETVYMLFDVDEVDRVLKALADAPRQSAPESDGTWPPDAAQPGPRGGS